MFINPFIPLVDSNILISFFIKDQHFNQAAAVLAKSIYLNDYILCEVLNFIQNKFSIQHSLSA